MKLKTIHDARDSSALSILHPEEQLFVSTITGLLCEPDDVNAVAFFPDEINLAPLRLVDGEDDEGFLNWWADESNCIDHLIDAAKASFKRKMRLLNGRRSVHDAHLPRIKEAVRDRVEAKRKGKYADLDAARVGFRRSPEKVRIKDEDQAFEVLAVECPEAIKTEMSILVSKITDRVKEKHTKVFETYRENKFYCRSLTDKEQEKNNG